MSATTPDNPAGPFQPIVDYGVDECAGLIDSIRRAPLRLRDAVFGLDDAQLDTLYRQWTIRQIVHHLADSHMHSYIRFKWTLTEDIPTIKAYEEADWIATDDARLGDIAPPLALFTGLHAKWTQLLESMTPQQFARTFFHPQSEETVDLWNALNYYAWHCQHHTAQINWLRDKHGWNESAVDSIRVSESKDVSQSAILDLYRALNWSSAEKPDQLLAALQNSDALVTAWDGKKLVGLVNAISDGSLVVYYPHAAVHPDYQRQGIGRQMMARLMKRYANFHQHSVLADKDVVGFYERCGFELSNCPSMWIYDGSDH